MTNSSNPASAKATSPSANHVPDNAHGHGHQHTHGHHHHQRSAKEWAERIDRPERAQWQKPKAVVALMAITPGMTVVDIGAGTGYFLKSLSEAVGPQGSVWALDVQQDLIDHMKQRAADEKLSNVKLRVIPFDDPQLAEGSVDRILLVNTWHHIEGREAYAARLRKTLKPEGRLVIVDFTMSATVGPPADHKLAAEQVIKELRAAGFRVSVLPESLEQQYVIEGRP